MKKINIFLILSLIILIFIVYANAVKTTFVFDDRKLVRDNPLIENLSNIPLFFKTDIWAHTGKSKPISNSYRPMQTVTYAADYFLWGNEASGFHFTNILIHILNTILIFYIIARITNNRIASYFTSLLFAIHPANTACVTYVAGRADLLSAMFVLLSFMFYIKYDEREKPYFLALSVLSYAGGVYSKEYTILVLPLLILLYSAVFKIRNIFPIKRFIFYSLPLLIYFPMRIKALSGITSLNLGLSKITLFPRFFTSLKTLFIDLRILLLPCDLHFARRTSVENSIFGSMQALLTSLGIFASILLFIYLYNTWRRKHLRNSGIIFFGGMWFVLSMVPFLNIYPLQVFHADNWLYLSSIGVYLIFGIAVNTVLQYLKSKSKVFNYAFIAVICMIFFTYGFLTFTRNKDYKDELTFYLSNVEYEPNVKFYRVIGGLYGEKKDYKNSIKYLKLAVETNMIYPAPKEMPSVYYNLGITYMHERDYGKAKEMFIKVLDSDNMPLKPEARKQILYIERFQ